MKDDLYITFVLTTTALANQTSKLLIRFWSPSCFLCNMLVLQGYTVGGEITKMFCVGVSLRNRGKGNGYRVRIRISLRFQSGGCNLNDSSWRRQVTDVEAGALGVLVLASVLIAVGAFGYGGQIVFCVGVTLMTRSKVRCVSASGSKQKEMLCEVSWCDRHKQCRSKLRDI